MDCHRGQPAEKTPRHQPAARTIGTRLRDHRQDAGGRTLQHGRAQPAHEPDRRVDVSQRLQVLQVFHQREARADGEAEDGGVDQEPDARGRDQGNQQQRFEHFLRHRCNVAAQYVRRNATWLAEPVIEQAGEHRRERAIAQHPGNHGRPDQAERVHHEQRGQEDHDGDEGNRDVDQNALIAES
jgi:hypothetical protein